MKNKRIFIYLIFILLFINTSCSFVKNEDKKDAVVEAHADLILYNSTYKVKKNQNSPILLEADKIELFEKESIVIANKLTFLQKNESDEIELSGKADYAHINESNQNVELKGDINLKIEKEDLYIKCSSINWNNESKILNTEDKDIEVTFKKGNKIIGDGFTANLSNRTFEFLEIKKGIINEEN